MRAATHESTDLSRRHQVTILYAVLAAVTALAFVFVVGFSGDHDAQPGVAGTYTISPPSACLGSEVDLKQSGRFITLGTAKGGDPSAKARLDDERVTGDANCRDGPDGPLDASIAGDRFSGSVAGERFEGRLTADAPAPGTKVERPPDPVVGEHELSPRSDR